MQNSMPSLIENLYILFNIFEYNIFYLCLPHKPYNNSMKWILLFLFLLMKLRLKKVMKSAQNTVLLNRRNEI